MTYVAWLRGVNVGGNAMISMRQLVLTLQGMGLGNVRSYINSGNLVFDAPAGSEKRLGQAIEEAIETEFGFRPLVLLRTRAQMEPVVAALDALPEGDGPLRVDIAFVAADVDSPGILDQLAVNPAVDHLVYVPGAVIVWRLVAEVSRSRLNKVVGTAVYKRMSLRNANTVRKVFAMMTSQVRPTMT